MSEEKKSMRKETKIVLWILGLGAMVTTALIIGVILLLQDDNEMLDEDPRWLYVDLRIPLTASPQPMGIFDDPSTAPPLTTEMAYLIRQAGNDEKVLGIRAELGGLGLGWAQVEELRQAFLDYRESGKECKIWATRQTITGNEIRLTIFYGLSSATRRVHPRVDTLSISRLHSDSHDLIQS